MTPTPPAVGVNWQIPHESFRAVFLELLYSQDGAAADKGALENAGKCGTASGFLYRVDGDCFLVTAGHVLSGRHWETSEYGSRHSVEPTHVRIGFREAPKDGKYDATIPHPIHQFATPLLNGEGNPAWVEHPRYGHTMDVGALRINNIEKIETHYKAQVLAWESVASKTLTQQLWVAQDVFVVGYPFGLSSGFQLPLWLRGTIASEPAFAYVHCGEPLPLFLIDARSREGQSGAPVLLYYHPGSLVPRGDGTAQITGAGYSQLLGVYSGRTSDESDLGFVWRIQAIPELCRSGVPPDPTSWTNRLAT
jgi:hypothetical protein